MKKSIKILAAVVAIVMFNTDAHALKPFRLQRDREPILRLPEAPTSAPFDGGLSVLVAAGIAYASKRGYNKMKSNKKNKETV